MASGVWCSHDASRDGFGTLPDSDVSDASDAGTFAPVMSCEPECPPPGFRCSGVPASVPGGGCPVGLVSENGCCDTCAEFTGVMGSVAADDAGRCSESSVAEGPCCAVCSNLGPGAVAIGDAGACPGDLVRIGFGCCAPCSDSAPGRRRASGRLGDLPGRLWPHRLRLGRSVPRSPVLRADAGRQRPSATRCRRRRCRRRRRVAAR